MKAYNFTFIHGFLGRAKDWEPVVESLSSKISINSIHLENLFHPQTQSFNNFSDWVNNFELPQTENNILVGYSLGGRLALHLFLKQPQCWDKIFLLSSNPGLVEDIEARRSWEKTWKKRFECEDWEELIKKWDSQEVFNGSRPRKLHEHEFSRKLLAESLSNWSHTRHEFQLETLCDYGEKLHWLYGKKDLKYLQLVDKLKAQGVPGAYQIIEDASHRLLEWPIELSQILANAMK